MEKSLLHYPTYVSRHARLPVSYCGLTTQLIINRINEHARLPREVITFFDGIPENDKALLRNISKIALKSVLRNETKIRGLHESCMTCHSDIIKVEEVEFGCTCSTISSGERATDSFY